MLYRRALPLLRYHLLQLFDAKDQAEHLMDDLLLLQAWPIDPVTKAAFWQARP
jgi:hypothetical protein